MQNKKCCKHFWTLGSNITQILTFNNLEKSSEQVNRDFSYSLCRAFHGASFKRKIKMLSFSQAKIYAKQKVFQTGTVW